MRRFLLLLLVVLVGAPAASAQTALLRGFVTDDSDGEALQGVNVVLLDGERLVTGTATDGDGLYALSRVEPGTYTLRATFIGYATRTERITLSAGEIRVFSFRMQSEAAGLDEVTIEGEREGTGAAAIVAGFQAVRPQDIEMIPSPDVSGDLVQYMATLPGVVSVGDQGGQLFIRGGEPTQNLALIDGIPIYQPFHLIGFYSAFPSDIIQVANIYAGGYGARFGGRLSSVLDISTRNGNKRRFEGNVSVAPFMSGALLEGPILPGRVSILASGRMSVIEQGASRLIDRDLPYTFDDQFVKLHANVSEGSTLSIVSNRSYDRGTLDPESAADTTSNRGTASWKNRANGLRYLMLPTSIPIQAEIILSYSETSNTFGAGRAARSSDASQFNAGAHVTHYLGASEMRWGIQLSTTSLSSELGGQFQGVSTSGEYITEAGVYVETGLPVGFGLRIEPGVRLASFPSKSSTFLEPRVRAVWDLGAHRFTGAAGIFHQEVVGLTDRRDAGDVFTAWTASPLAKVPSAWHLIAGWQVQATPWMRFSVEGYRKGLSNLSIAAWTAYPRFNTGLQPAEGEVTGADVRLEMTTDRVYGLLNYGYGKVRYTAQQEAIRYWYGRPDLEFSPPHDRRHQANAILGLKVLGFDVNTRWQFGSGLPYSQSLGFDEFLLLAGPTGVDTLRGDTRVLYAQPYGGRLPTYHRLDVSVERTMRFRGTTRLTLQAGVTNLYDRRNLFYIDIFTLRRLDQLPLIPSVGIKVAY